MKKNFDDKWNTMLSVIIEKWIVNHEVRWEEDLKEKVQWVKEINQWVAEKVQKAHLEDEWKHQDMLNKWEGKIEKAREKRELLLKKWKLTL